MKNYAFFAWCHLWLFYFVYPGHLLNKVTLNGGLIWYVMPMIIITINDIGAYMIGFFGGRTPLIKLSPKKTKEGFIGGAIITMILGTIFVHYLIHPYLICPIETNPQFFTNLFLHFSVEEPLFSITQCTPGPVFQPQSVSVRF